MPTLDDAEEFRAAVRKLRHDLGVGANYEFKFHKTHTFPKARQVFLAAALARDFRFTVSSIDKTTDYWSAADGPEQHWACATCLAVQLRSIYHQAEEKFGVPLREPIVVDDNSDRHFLAMIKKQFRALVSKVQPRSSLVGSVLFRKSALEEMLHLADMVCGAVGAHLDGTDSSWYKLIAGRDLGILCVP